MAGILGGSFYLMAALRAALSLALPRILPIAPATFGVVLAVGLVFPGWRDSREVT